MIASRGVLLATIVGLIGSRLYGLGEACRYSPARSFSYSAPLETMFVLLRTCVALLAYMFVGGLPEWVEKAMRRNDEA